MRRVVITGMGVVSPLGLTAAETWSRAIEGKSGVGPITQFNVNEYASGPCAVSFAAEVRGFEVSKPLAQSIRPRLDAEPLLVAANAKEARKMGRYTQLALAAGIDAYVDSGLDSVRGTLDSTRMGVNIGVGMGGMNEIEQERDTLNAKGYRRVSPFFIPSVIANMASGHLSILLNAQGPNLCNVTACTSSAHSLGESFHIIRRGDADVMIAGGAEAVISPLSVGGFASMRALSTRNDAPEKASRPFDVNRDGFVIGEGSAVLILEEFEHAKKRGARIYGELCGYGLSGDAYHMTSPAPEGAGGARAMAGALRSAGLNPDQVGYVNAHGTSTPAGDAEEARAIRKVFPDAPTHLQVSSTKSMTGHLLGAAGAIEAFFSVMAVREGIIPPTINLDELDPGCVETKMNFTPHRAERRKIRYALSNSFGFGGTNASLIVGSI